MARDDLHFRLRLPEELKRQIEAAADANHRSMTAEIVSRLEESFQDTAEDVKFVFRQHDELVELNRRYNELHASYKKQMEHIERRRLMQAEDIVARSREAASAAMTVIMHGYLSAARAVDRKDRDELHSVLMPILGQLEFAIRSDDPYATLQDIRNEIVHPPKPRDTASRRRAIRSTKPSDTEGGG